MRPCAVPGGCHQDRGYSTRGQHRPSPAHTSLCRNSISPLSFLPIPRAQDRKRLIPSMVALRSSSSNHSLPHRCGAGHSHTRSLPQNGELSEAQSGGGGARSLRSGSQSQPHPQRRPSTRSRSGGRPSTATENTAEDDEFESLIAGKDTLKMSLTPSRFKFGGTGAPSSDVRYSFGLPLTWKSHAKRR